MSTQEQRVEVMGTTAHLLVNGGPADLLECGVQRIHALEAKWSRFRAESEVSRLNELPGVPVLVSPETYLLVERAIDGWRMTDGLFDPTLLRELRAAGYDRSYDALDTTSPVGAGVLVPRDHSYLPARRGADAIRLDPIVGTVCIEPGVEFDPGGIGKGVAADLVVEEMLNGGAEGALVSIGGDLRAEGVAPESAGWVVAVTNPLDLTQTIATLCVQAGAVASTWRTKRTWRGTDGAARHHLIDPRTGMCAASGLAGVTVVAGRGWQAEVLAKAAFLGGSEAVERLLEAHGASALLVTDAGDAIPVGDVASFLIGDLHAQQEH